MQSGSPSVQFLKFASQSLGLFLVGGSIPIKKDDKIFNRTLIYDEGKYLGHYNKMHTFDINIPGVF